jgi:hypothetical protein
MMVPNFHFYEHTEFLKRWHAADGRGGEDG